jgi:hypothetical protein
MAGFTVFEETFGRALQVERTTSRGGTGGIYQWAAYATIHEGRSVTVAQVPHFSRALPPALGGMRPLAGRRRRVDGLNPPPGRRQTIVG